MVLYESKGMPPVIAHRPASLGNRETSKRLELIRRRLSVDELDVHRPLQGEEVQWTPDILERGRDGHSAAAHASSHR